MVSASKILCASFLALISLSSIHGYASTWYEAVDCIACTTSGSTYTWWQDGSKYDCTDSVWDEGICPMYSTCTFQASTCEVSTSQFMCADAAEQLTQTDCADVFVTTLDGVYTVVSMPPASYCTLTISNEYGVKAEEEEDVIEQQLFMRSLEAVSGKGKDPNKSYSNILNIGTLQSSQCIKMQFDVGSEERLGAGEWHGFYEELEPKGKISLQLMNFEKTCTTEIAIYSWGTEK
jgi:hypothetical protein